MIVLPLAPSKFKYKSIPLNGDVILALIIIMYFMRMLFVRDTRVNFIKGIKDFFTDYLTISLLILSFSMVISIFYSVDKKVALGETFRFISYVILFFILKYEVRLRHIVDNIIKIYIFTCFLVFSYGILEYYLLPHVMIAKNVLTNYRMMSTLENSNNLAAFALISIFPLIVLFLNQKDVLKKIMYFIISMLALVNIVLSQSRNALIAVALGCVILCFIYSYKL